jgi:3-methyladenine DNA glycosylase AlkD
MSQIAERIILAIKKEANPQKAKHSQRFFKTAPGEYGEGDLFLGVSTPVKRGIAKKFKKLIKLNDLPNLINNPYHDIRQVGLFLLVELYKKASSQTEKKHLVSFYLGHSHFVNNWDLVDISADKILGQYLLEKNFDQNKQIIKKVPDLLIKLAKSDLLWDRRIAVLSTFPFIREEEFLPTLELAKLLINDQEDLIHKATGWLLREVGKRNEQVLTAFLDQYALKMPRTMLRYSIEKFPKKKRQYYLKKS